MEAARAHDRAADRERDAEAAASSEVAHGDRFACGDDVLNDQLTTGGTRVTTWTPCWDAEEEAAAHHRYLAALERARAYADRRAAAHQEEAVLAACAPIAPREREHSPFAHRKEISRVEPMSQHGVLRGVRVVFAPVRGLDAAWLRADIACHRALWRLHGSDPKESPDDPTLVDGARVDVADRDDHVEVVAATRTRAAALVALARARGELTAAR